MEEADLALAFTRFLQQHRSGSGANNPGNQTIAGSTGEPALPTAPPSGSERNRLHANSNANANASNAVDVDEDVVIMDPELELDGEEEPGEVIAVPR